jgi:Spy/CpxP family protein refolding chaperone
LILLVFALGATTGASLNRLITSEKSADRRAASSGRHDGAAFMTAPLPPFIGRMQDELKLTDEQITAIHKIMIETRRELNVKNLEECPGFKEARIRVQTRINSVLNPEQQILFRELNARREAEFAEPTQESEPR